MKKTSASNNYNAQKISVITIITHFKGVITVGSTTELPTGGFLKSKFQGFKWREGGFGSKIFVPFTKMGSTTL